MDDMKDHFRINYDISHYYRFKDDIFFVMDYYDNGMEFFYFLQRRGYYFISYDIREWRSNRLDSY